MINLPQAYIDNMKELLKDEYKQYEASFNNEINNGLRVNTNKISVEDFLKLVPFKLEPIPWTDDGFYYQKEDCVSKSPYYYAGLYYLQEASAMLPAQALPIEKNDKVLDLCAAPGGKSTKIICKLKDTGVLVSNDISVSRSQVLLKNLENFGSKNYYVLSENPNKLVDYFPKYFDKILIDAPCSGEGMFHKDQSLIKSWLEKGNLYYQNIQKDIVTNALKMLKDGGEIVYSTCTFSKLEDEDIVEYMLDICPELSVETICNSEMFEHGLTPRTKNCVRLYPHKIKGEGHFVAHLKKQGNRKENSFISNDNKPTYLQDFNLKLTNEKYETRNNKTYYIPSLDIDTNGLRILRSGLYIGEEKHGKFDYSHSLALAIKKDEYSNIIDFDIDDPRVIKYLKCETLDVSDYSNQGLTLICVNGYPLGFGIIKNGILKNKYPANYRYQ